MATLTRIAMRMPSPTGADLGRPAAARHPPAAIAGGGDEDGAEPVGGGAEQGIDPRITLIEDAEIDDLVGKSGSQQVCREGVIVVVIDVVDARSDAGSTSKSMPPCVPLLLPSTCPTVMPWPVNPG